MLEKMNYKVNKQVDLPLEVINGQALGQVSKFRLGYFSFGYCGCEMIALYNATLLLGGKPDLAEITKECYKRCVFFWGIFGSTPGCLRCYFKDKNIGYRAYRSYDKFWSRIKDGKIGVVSFWNAKNPFKGIHTVCVQEVDGKIRVYNRSNHRGTPADYDRPEDFFPKGTQFIVGYTDFDMENYNE